MLVFLFGTTSSAFCAKKRAFAFLLFQREIVSISNFFPYEILLPSIILSALVHKRKSFSSCFLVEKFQFLLWCVCFYDVLLVPREHWKRSWQGSIIFDFWLYSDGAGRSGVYLAIDANIELSEEDGVFDVYGYLVKMRQQRRGLVETLVSAKSSKS